MAGPQAAVFWGERTAAKDCAIVKAVGLLGGYRQSPLVAGQRTRGGVDPPGAPELHALFRARPRQAPLEHLLPVGQGVGG